MPIGRPPKYDPKFVQQAFTAVSRMGATDPDLAELFQVDERTINRWKNDHADFCHALKDGKDLWDTGQVANALRKRALGCTRQVERISKDGPVMCTEELPPDPTSMIFWLKNRDPNRWRDKQEVEHSGDLSINIIIGEKAIDFDKS